MTDYAACNKKYRSQKAALTRAINSGQPHKVYEACEKAVFEWRCEPFNGMWPDGWSRWSIALFDAGYRLHLDDLR